MVKRALIHQLVDAEKALPQHIPLRGPRPGGVIWIACHSVADTKTIAEALKGRLREDGIAAVVLISNDLESVFTTRPEQDATAPLAVARSQGKLCQILAHQGQTVICVNTIMRRQVFDWNRNALPNYLEVYLERPSSTPDDTGCITEVPQNAHLHISAAEDTTQDQICDAVQAKMEELLFV